MVALRLKYRRCKEEGGLWLCFYAVSYFRRGKTWQRGSHGTFAASAIAPAWLQLHVVNSRLHHPDPLAPHSSMLSSFAANRFGVHVEAEEEAAGDDDAACLALAL